jgi:hypothetical protein
MGAIMLRIIYSLLLLVIFLCSAASVIWFLSFVGFELLLLAGLTGPACGCWLPGVGGVDC